MILLATMTVQSQMVPGLQLIKNFIILPVYTILFIVRLFRLIVQCAFTF